MENGQIMYYVLSPIVGMFLYGKLIKNEKTDKYKILVKLQAD